VSVDSSSFSPEEIDAWFDISLFRTQEATIAAMAAAPTASPILDQSVKIPLYP